MWVCLAVFVGLLTVVFARLVTLETRGGDVFRAAANQPLERRSVLPGVRGRILTRDGTVLAVDRKVLALAVHYRYLEEPCRADWLRLTARSRLAPAERRDAKRVAAEEARVRAERGDLARRLTQLSGLSAQEWQRRVRQIQTNVERIAASVNERQRSASETAASRVGDDPAPSARGWPRWLADVLKGSMHESSRRIVVAEERASHVVVEDIPLQLVAEVETHRQFYPGVKIVERWRRSYPGGPLAAHVSGHLGPRTSQDSPASSAADTADDLVARAGVERHYEARLAGSPGLLVEMTDHAGRVEHVSRQREPGIGRDAVLTLDGRLQTAAESLLDAALARRPVTLAGSDLPPAGGAIVVLDVQTGAILTAASAPRFDPNWFAGGNAPRLASALTDPAHPLFDRVASMAIAPGSVFKLVTSVALLESAAFDPRQPLDCRGYLDEPERWRCAVYQHTGHGHGPVGLVDALAQSCNVYFFQHAREMGPARLVDWALRLGLGRPTGIDLPSEAAGNVPMPDSGSDARHTWHPADTMALSIGQGTLTATPLQIACLMAALANGGRRVQPHIVSGFGLTSSGTPRAAKPEDSGDDRLDSRPSHPIAGLHPATLETIAAGMRQAVDDPAGTAYGSVRLESIRVAGKTGTAQTAPGQPEHAWFAGYVPADHPRWALVIALEYSGDAAPAAGPVARRLVQQMEQLGIMR